MLYQGKKISQVMVSSGFERLTELLGLFISSFQSRQHCCGTVQGKNVCYEDFIEIVVNDI